MSVEHLSDTARQRALRQMMLAGFTEEHQRRLASASVLIAGVGGLGGAVATYLAVAGVGRIRFTHAGNLTRTNMNRQTLMTDADIGTPRAPVAAKRLAAMNPDIAVEGFDVRMDDDNTPGFLDGIDLAVSTRPNFAERRALNRACVAMKIPMIETAMNGMSGYFFTVEPGLSPCLACIIGEDEPEWEERGFPVLGAVSGALGCFVAIEAVKRLSGYGDPMRSEMLVMDFVSYATTKARMVRKPDCPVCGGL